MSMQGTRNRGSSGDAVWADQHGRPGYAEAGWGLAVLAVVGFGGGIGLARLHLDPVTTGLIFTALSGIAGLAGFGAAFLYGSRSWAAFGVRRTSVRWLLIGAMTGVLAFALKILVSMILVHVFGTSKDVQAIYAEGAGGGWATIALTILFLAVLTPLGEEFFFRGVVTNALLRHGPLIGVIVGALVFALFHGFNIVFPGALIVGLATSELFRRSGSVWPGVVVHIVFNLPTIPAMLLMSAH